MVDYQKMGMMMQYLIITRIEVIDPRIAISEKNEYAMNLVMSHLNQLHVYNGLFEFICSQAAFDHVYIMNAIK